MTNIDKRVPVGVGVIIFNDKGQILLGKRRGSHGAGTWAPPGGKPDVGEAPWDAGIREVLEETGVDLSVEEAWYDTVWYHSYDKFEHEQIHYVTLYYEAQMPPGAPDPIVTEPDKCECWAWCDPNDPPAPLFPGVQNALNYIAEMMV